MKENKNPWWWRSEPKPKSSFSEQSDCQQQMQKVSLIHVQIISSERIFDDEETFRRFLSI